MQVAGHTTKKVPNLALPEPYATCIQWVVYRVAIREIAVIVLPRPISSASIEP